LKWLINPIFALTFFLGAKSTSIRDCVGWLVGWFVGPSVRPSVPTMQLRGKLVASRLLREEEEEEENWLRRDPLVWLEEALVL
jgi:hypothetical protein